MHKMRFRILILLRNIPVGDEGGRILESRYIDAGGLRMHYLEAGVGAPVIAIHGWPQTSHEWVRIAPLLGKACRVLAPDTRGHGRTAAPASGYDRAQLALDIVRFMDAHGIDKCPVIAHDWGGIIATKLALDHPERVERLALLDTITTGWPTFVQYYYWFMDGDRAERFFAKYARQFIDFLIGGRLPNGFPVPPESPFPIDLFALTAPDPWATEEDLAAYAEPYLRSDEAGVSCAYYRSLRFHRVIVDANAPNGERYERVPAAEMGRMWNRQEIPAEYLDFAPEDRHKAYPGKTLWLYTKGVAEASGSRIDERGVPRGDPAFESFPRHFPRLEAVAVGGGHFFIEERPQATAKLLLRFLAA
jgi:pimeloyl-ACP methyl ester carboxylesterase